ncbi:unnamed protein product [Mycena citricolor]|uniref:RING-type domain-containing protein n=1 Tax=Mycena citricolor TaxID=2018698 RepID=A0AAD2HRT4_9AGAR|nr:unnamed protein product [Mycena citricolor]
MTSRKRAISISSDGSSQSTDVWIQSEASSSSKPIRAARKSTGGKRPREVEPSKSASTRYQYARKSTGGQPPRASGSSDPTPSSSMIPYVPLARAKVTGPHCGLCTNPLPTPYAPIDSIHRFSMRCEHDLHYCCYMAYISQAVAPVGMKDSCPECRESILSDGRYWVRATSHAGEQTPVDITDRVLARLKMVKNAKQQLFFDMLEIRNVVLASALLEGSDPIDVNFQSLTTGISALHICALKNDVPGIEFLLKSVGSPAVTFFSLCDVNLSDTETGRIKTRKRLPV